MKTIAMFFLLVCACAFSADTSGARLHEAVAVVAPIEGVSIGAIGVTASVKVKFAAEATAEQRAAAAAVVAAFDWSDAAGVAKRTVDAAEKAGELAAARSYWAKVKGSELGKFLRIVLKHGVKLDELE